MVYWQNPRFGALGLALLALARTAGGRFLHLSFYVLAAYLLLAFLYLRYVSHNLTLLLEPTSRVVTSQESISIRLRLYNEGILPIPLLFVEPPDLTRRTALRTRQDPAMWGMAAPLGPMRSLVTSFTLNCPGRGRKEVGPLNLTVIDPLGVLRLEISGMGRGYITVYPGYDKIARFPLPTRQPYGRAKRFEHTSEDKSSVKDLRPFRRGDSHRQIDWKATAKHRTRLVRQYELLAGADIYIILDLHVGRSLPGESLPNSEPVIGSPTLAIGTTRLPEPEWIDRIVRSGVTIADYALRMGHAVSIHSCGQRHHKLPPGRGLRHFTAVLELAATAESGNTHDSALLLRDLSRNLPYRSTIVLITSRRDTSTNEAQMAAVARGHSLVQVYCPQESEAGSAPDADWTRSGPVPSMPSDARPESAGGSTTVSVTVRAGSTLARAIGENASEQYRGHDGFGSGATGLAGGAHV